MNIYLPVTANHMESQLTPEVSKECLSSEIWKMTWVKYFSREELPKVGESCVLQGPSVGRAFNSLMKGCKLGVVSACPAGSHVWSCDTPSAFCWHSVVDVKYQLVFPSGSVVKNPLANAGDPDSIPRSGRSLGKGNGNPLQYCCLGNPIDGGTWWAVVCGSQRVEHNLATKQQQNTSYVASSLSDNFFLSVWNLV